MSDLVYLEPRSVFDPMIIGVSYSPHALVYDLDALLHYWTEQFKADGVGESEASSQAWGHLEFNVLGSYMGEHTPIYISKDVLEVLED